MAQYWGRRPSQQTWHGPRMLYSRDGKFRATFKSGTVKRRFSVPLLMSWSHRIDLPVCKLNTSSCTFTVTLVAKNAPNCTDLHLYFQNFSRGDTPGSHNWEGVGTRPKPLPLVAHPPSHFFRASAAAETRFSGSAEDSADHTGACIYPGPAR